MNKSQIRKYLDFLNMKDMEKMSLKKCEICENKKSYLVRKKISWNNNKYGILPVHCCSNCGFVFQNPRFSKNFYFKYYQGSYGQKVIMTKHTILPRNRFF